MSITSSKIRRLSITAIYAIAMLYCVVQGYTKPFMNWDMISYVGSVISWSEKNDDAIYAKTMATLKANVPNDIYVQYVGNELSSNSKALVEHLPISQVKPLYTATMWLFNKFGMDLPVASWTISALSFAALAILLFLWRTHYMPHEVWLLLVLGLTFLWPWPMATLPHSSTPDALCTLLSTAALYFWVFRRSFWGFGICAWLATLARPDALILCGAFASYFVLFAPKEQRMAPLPAAGIILFLFTSYNLVSHLAGAYSWQTLFYYSFIYSMPNPAEMQVHLTVAQYLQAFTFYLGKMLMLGRTITMIALSLFACFSYYKQPVPGNRFWLGLLGITWAATAAHFVLFTSYEDRYYFPYYLPILAACGELCAPYVITLWGLVKKHFPQPPSS